VSGAVQSDGAGGAALFTPDFMVSYLTFMSKQKSAADFQHALPILGQDGTLAKISRGTSAAGQRVRQDRHLRQRRSPEPRAGRRRQRSRGLPHDPLGQRLAFAVYINRVKLTDPKAIQDQVGQAAGDVAAAIYDAVP